LKPEGHDPLVELWRTGLRIIAALGFIAAGINHFAKPQFYREIVPPGFPSPAALVAISGFFEILGGIGLLMPPLRRWAGWGLIALLIAVFPANIYMAVEPQRFASMHIAPWVLRARLPLQCVFVVWIWFVAINRRLRADAPRIISTPT